MLICEWRCLSIQTLEEKPHVDAHRVGNAKEPARRNTIDTLFVLMRLLVGHANHFCQLVLSQAKHGAAFPNALTDVPVNLFKSVLIVV